MSPYLDERRASWERFRGSNSPGNSAGGMVSRWLDAQNVTATNTENRFSGTRSPRGVVVARTRAREAIFQTFSREARDLFNVPTTLERITISPQPQPQLHTPALASHFDPPSVFESYGTTPSTSAVPSPSWQTCASSLPSQEQALARVNTRLDSWRDSRVQSEHRSSSSSVREQRYTRYSSAPARIAGGGSRRVFTAGATTQRTLGDMALEDTDAIRSFWAEIGTEVRMESDDGYAYVAVGVRDVDPVEQEEEREYLSALASGLDYRLEYPDTAQTSVAAPGWSDASSSSSESSLSSGGLTDWGFATPPQPHSDGGSPDFGIAFWGTSVEGVEMEGGDASSMQENSSPLTLPETWVDTLAPFVFPASPEREVPSIFAFSSSSPSAGPALTPESYPLRPSSLTQSRELESWTVQNLAAYSRLSSTSTSPTLSYRTLPISPGSSQNITTAEPTACPVCYENPVSCEFPCSIWGAQHGLCRSCFVTYEAYCTEIVRCPLCRHEFFRSQVVVIGSAVGAERGGEEEGEGEEERVGGDEGFGVVSEVDGEHEVVDEEDIEFYMGGYSV